MNALLNTAVTLYSSTGYVQGTLTRSGELWSVAGVTFSDRQISCYDPENARIILDL